MLGGTSNISQFCKDGLYDWVMFRYEPTKYSDKNPVLDKYFGPEIDVLLAMTAKIMKANGKVVHRSTYRGIK